MRHFARRAIVATLVFLIAPAPGADAQEELPETGPAALVREAERSPLFERELSPDRLDGEAALVGVHEGISVDLRDYLEATRLTSRANLRPVLRSPHLARAPRYEERLLRLEDRVVVDRVLRIDLKPGACLENEGDERLDAVCFRKKRGEIQKEVARGLEEVRERLAKADPRREVAPGVSAGEAREMEDVDLLGLLVNGKTRTIRLASVVPLRIYDVRPEGLGLTNFRNRLPKSDLVMSPALMEALRSAAQTIDARDEVEFESRYFLTGFTLGRSTHDSWEYEFAEESWCCDRYYVRLSYEVSVGLGLRVPFSLDVRASPVRGEPDWEIELAAETVDVDSRGEPAYSATGLDQSQYFRGREFVMEASAGCDFHASIPGPDLTGPDCPSIDEDASRDFDPVLGSGTNRLADVILLPASVSGLRLSGGIGSAGIDLGIRGELTDGRIRLSVAPDANTSLIGHRGMASLEYTVGGAKDLEIEPVDATRAIAFIVEDPAYAAALELMPLVAPWIEIDLGVYDYEDELGPWAIDALAISFDVDLERHEGTVAEHRYEIEGR